MEQKKGKASNKKVEGTEMVFCTAQRKRLIKVGPDTCKTVTVGDPIPCTPEMCRRYGGPEKWRDAVNKVPSGWNDGIMEAFVCILRPHRRENQGEIDRAKKVIAEYINEDVSYIARNIADIRQHMGMTEDQAEALWNGLRKFEKAASSSHEEPHKIID